MQHAKLVLTREWLHFNPMRLQRNRVVAEYNHRLAEVPMERGGLELVGKTVLYGQPMELRKFNVSCPRRRPRPTGKRCRG